MGCVFNSSELPSWTALVGMTPLSNGRKVSTLSWSIESSNHSRPVCDSSNVPISSLRLIYSFVDYSTRTLTRIRFIFRLKFRTRPCFECSNSHNKSDVRIQLLIHVVGLIEMVKYARESTFYNITFERAKAALKTHDAFNV